MGNANSVLHSRLQRNNHSAMDSSVAAVTFELLDHLTLMRAAIESSATIYLGALMMGNGLAGDGCDDSVGGSCGNATIILDGSDAAIGGSSNRTLGTCGCGDSVKSCTLVLSTLGRRRRGCRIARFPRTHRWSASMRATGRCPMRTA